MKMIVACDENFGIGYKGNLLVRIPEDMKRFKDLTMNDIVVMGRKTLESLPKGYLPNRYNVVISRDPLSHNQNLTVISNYQKIYSDSNGVIWCSDIDTVIKSYVNNKFCNKNVWVIGGGEIYKQLLPYCDTIFLTKFKLYKNYDVDTYIDDPLKMGFNNMVEVSDIYKTDDYEYCFYKFSK